MDPKTHQQLVKELKMEEGFRSQPYKNPNDFWTIGYGRNLEGLPLSDREFNYLFPTQSPSKNKLEWLLPYWRLRPMFQHEAIFLLEEVIDNCEEEALQVYGDVYKDYVVDVKVIVLDMLYNLGITRYKGFKKHIKAIKKHNYTVAAKELRSSLAYKQDTNRYEAMASTLERINNGN